MFGFVFSGRVQFQGGFLKDGCQHFGVVTSVEEVGEKAGCVGNVVLLSGVLFPEALEVAIDETLEYTGGVCRSWGDV